MKKFIIGILAHVDAGKTTLSESLLYISGKIQKLGRVDKKDAYLDNFELERARGITIFSKQATLEVDDTEITLLDTPGHVDFSAEMERTIQVMDYAILVINGAEGVQGHTKTLWHLLGIYKIPVFIFVNKMDQQRIEKEDLLSCSSVFSISIMSSRADKISLPVPLIIICCTPSDVATVISYFF
jgi:ribosomal protection tetracycline resistance protein